MSLVEHVIASHYAEPVARALRTTAELRVAPSAESDVIRQLHAGEPFDLLDDSVGWSWGYAGKERRVGYVQSDALQRLDQGPQPD